jgi:CheY-like chemotaxis protein
MHDSNATSPAPPPGAVSPLRILYVEDNPVVRELTCELLEQGLREVVAFGTAEEALRVFNQVSFDVVITDISLPVMSGLDLARNILNLRPEAPIIIASAYSLSDGLQNFGPNVRAIVKPFEAGEINSLIDDLCGGASQ